MKLLKLEILFLAAILLAVLPARSLRAQGWGSVGLKLPGEVGASLPFSLSEPSHLGEAVFAGTSSDRPAVWAMVRSSNGFTFEELATFDSFPTAAAGELDSDGFRDLALLFRDTDEVQVILGRGDGNHEFISAEVDLSDLANSAALSAGIADLSGDGAGDIVVTDGYTILAFRGEVSSTAGTASFTRLTTISSLPRPEGLSTGFSHFIFGDFDRNRRTDFVVGGAVYLNLGAGFFVPKSLPSGTADVMLKLRETAVNADSDGNTELLFTRLGGSGQTILQPADYHPERIFLMNGTLAESVYSIRNILYDDLDSDGPKELVLFSDRGFTGELVVFEGDALEGLNREPDTLIIQRDVRGTMLRAVEMPPDSARGWVFIDTARDSLYIYHKLGAYFDNSEKNGLGLEMAGTSVAAGDFNSDGLVDFFVVNASGKNSLFRNNGDRTYTDVADQAGVAAGSDGVSCAWGDYNNDGHPDLFVTSMLLPGKLFHNNGNGTFSDSSRLLRLDWGRHRATSVSLGDVNRDSYLDALIGNYDGGNWLMINRSGRYFEEQSAGHGLDYDSNTESASLVDVNLDGWQDILDLSEGAPVRLFLGGQGGMFGEATDSSGLNPRNEPGRFGQTQAWGDFNGDGYPDLHITRAQDDDMLFLNRGKARTGELFINKFTGPLNGSYCRIASVIEDFNGDGYPDLLVARTSVFGEFFSFPQDLFFLGSSLGHPDLPYRYPSGFSLIELTQAVNHLPTGLDRINGESSLPLTGDFDGDGDIDLFYVNYLPDNPSDLFRGSALPLRYMENQSGYANTVTVRLARGDHRSVIGSAVQLARGGRIWWKQVSGGAGRIQESSSLTFSLGQSPSADSIVVLWARGERQVMRGPIFPGTVDILTDRSGPSITVTDWPADTSPESETPVVARPEGFPMTVALDDASPVAVFRMVSRIDGAETADTVGRDKITAPETLSLVLPSPAPGGSVLYYLEAEDVYGNRTRVPAVSAYRLDTVSGVRPGDINLDGKVDIYDLLRLNAILAGRVTDLTPVQLSAADLNADGRVDVQDLVGILKLISKNG